MITNDIKLALVSVAIAFVFYKVHESYSDKIDALNIQITTLEQVANDTNTVQTIFNDDNEYILASANRMLDEQGCNSELSSTISYSSNANYSKRNNYMGTQDRVRLMQFEKSTGQQFTDKELSTVLQLINTK